MKLSIITVNLNNRDGLQKTIDSVVSQTFKDFEWIVIDGGSTDGSEELIAQYADHFAYWVSEPDKGIYNAMNKGIKVANGEYLLFLNSGDWLYGENILEECFAINRNANILYCDCVIKKGSTFVNRNYSDNLSFAEFYDTSLCHQSTLIKAILLKDNLYDESLKIVSDWKFFLQKALEGRSFQHIDIPLSVYNLEGVSSINPDLLMDEKKNIGKCVVPSCILTDVDLINRLDKDWQLKEIMKYREKKRIYHKIITATITFIRLLDKLISRKNGNQR